MFLSLNHLYNFMIMTFFVSHQYKYILNICIDLYIVYALYTHYS